MRSFTDLHAAKGYDKGLRVLWAVCAACVCVQAWGAVRLRLMLVASLLGVLCVLPACRLQNKGGTATRLTTSGIPLDGASRANAAAVVTKNTPRGHYISKVKEKVSKKWNAYRSQRPNEVAFGMLEVDFSVNQLGKVENIHAHNTKETNPELTRFTVQAIKDAEIPPMPADVISSLLAMEHGCLKLSYYAQHFPQQENGGANPRTIIMGKLTSTPLDRYYRKVTGQVEKKWNIYLHLRRDGLTKGYLQLVFYVNKKGKVEGLKVINDKESTPLLTEITLRAIKDAKIPPMPADVIPLLPVEDRERLKIQYDALIY